MKPNRKTERAWWAWFKSLPENTQPTGWWFEVGGFTDEPNLSGADARWHWWKEAAPLMDASYLKHFWRSGEERAAYAYELLRRSSPKALRLPTYPELTSQERAFLKVTFGRSDRRTAAQILEPDCRPDGYSDRCPYRWNLRETDAALCKLFVRWLASERQTLGVKKPKARPTPSRPVSWKQLENFDANVGLGDSERSANAKLRQEAQNLAAQLKNALKSAPRKHRLRV